MRLRRRWVDNIKMDLGDKDGECIDWIRLAQDRDNGESSCEYGNEASSSIK
jgi:hypothetical protein